MIEACFEIYQNPQNTIQFIQPPIFKVVLKLNQRISQIILLLDTKNMNPFVSRSYKSVDPCNLATSLVWQVQIGTSLVWQVQIATSFNLISVLCQTR